MIDPLELITRLREIFPRYDEMSGGCIKFGALLKALYPQAKCYYSCDHLVTEIDGRIYDADGEWTDGLGDFLEASEFGSRLRKMPRGDEVV